MPLGVLFIIKTVKDEWYIVIEAYKFTVFEILRDICDLLRDNPAHPAKIDFLLEAIRVTKVTFGENVIIAAMGQQTLGLKDTRV